MRVAFTGGGTGGHIYPCLAVAELFEYENRHTDGQKSSIYYIGNAAKLEEELCSRKNYIQFLPINAPKLPSKSSSLKEKLTWFAEFHKAYKLSVDYIKKNKTDLVIAAGGYVAAPVFLACVSTKTKFLIHNLDSNFGLVNKLFRKFADIITLGFPMKLALSDKHHYTGNPVSHDFVRIYEALNPSDENLEADDSINLKMFLSEGEKESFSEKLKREKKKKLVDENHLKVLVSGGSQGSQFINDSVGALIKSFEDFNERLSLYGKRISIIHVTGPKLFKEHIDYHLDGNPHKYPNYKVLSYTHEMADICKEVDIAICRAGAMTCAEMAVTQTVPIFIPLPWAANDHQTKNAEALVNYGCGFMIRQDQTNNQKRQAEIFDLILELAKNSELLIEMKKKLRRFAKPESTKEIFTLLKSLVGDKSVSGVKTTA